MTALNRRRDQRQIQLGAQRIDTTRGLMRRPLYRPNALPWHSRAWTFYDGNADLHRGYTIKANTIANTRLYAAWRANPDDEPVPLDEAFTSADIDTAGLTAQVVADANDALWRVQSTDGGQAEILRLFALNLDVAGEGWLHGVDGPDENWNVYSVEQIRWQGGGYMLYDQPDAKGRPVGADDILIRVWRKHPRYTEASDSAFRALLDLLEQMHLLNSEVTAAASSRLAGSGLLLLDSRVDIPQPPDQQGAYNEAQAVMETLLEAMQTALSDASSAAAAVPLLFQAEPPDGSSVADMMSHLTFDRPLHEATVRRYLDLRKEIIEGADFPPEWVHGLGQTSTYANARIVTSEGYAQDVAPTAHLIASGIGSAWVRPTIIEAGTPKDVARKIVVWVDPDSVIAKPDRAKYAAELAKVGVSTGPLLSDEAVRAALGFDEGDAPPPEQVAAWQETQARRLPAAGAASDDNPNSGDAATQASVLPPIALGSGTPTAAKLARTSTQLAGIDVHLSARLHVAADKAVTDGLNRAGAQLRARAQGSKAQKARVRNVPNAEVFAMLGDTVAAFGTSETELLDGSLVTLEANYKRWTAAAQTQALRAAMAVRPGAYSAADVAVLESEQTTDREQGWGWLAVALLALMRGKLHDPKFGGADTRGEFDPSTVNVPFGHVRSAVSIAGGEPAAAAAQDFNAAGAPAGGVGTGALILGSLAALAGVTTGSYIWLHGAPARPFEPHEMLDQVEFTGWDDPVLANSGGWPFTDFFYPDDHDSCTCSAEHVLVVD